jgi:hypothetical protein
MENMEEKQIESEKRWKIQRKSKLNSEKIGKWVVVVVANFCNKCNY